MRSPITVLEGKRKKMELNCQVALVTGAAQGIGKAIARKLAEAGAKTYIFKDNLEAARHVAKELSTAGLSCTAVKCDVSDIPAARSVVGKIAEREGQIHILVNNAGITCKADLLEVSEADWDRVFQVNLRGPFFLTQEVLRNMVRHHFGSIVNVASISGEWGGRFAGIPYSCSKGGVITLTKSLALYGGDYGVRVNAVAPGLIRTAMADQLQFNTNDIPLGRLGEAEEVADAVLFLVSGQSTYMTGVVLDLNGGQLMR